MACVCGQIDFSSLTDKRNCLGQKCWLDERCGGSVPFCQQWCPRLVPWPTLLFDCAAFDGANEHPVSSSLGGISATIMNEYVCSDSTPTSCCRFMPGNPYNPYHPSFQRCRNCLELGWQNALLAILPEPFPKVWSGALTWPQKGKDTLGSRANSVVCVCQGSYSVGCSHELFYIYVIFFPVLLPEFS